MKKCTAAEKGKGKVGEAAKMARFASDPAGYIFGMVSEAELVLGSPVIRPSEEPLLQVGLSDHDSRDDEMSVYSYKGHGADDEVAKHEQHVNYAPWSHSLERRVTPPPLEA